MVGGKVVIYALICCYVKNIKFAMGGIALVISKSTHINAKSGLIHLLKSVNNFNEKKSKLSFLE